MSNIFGADARRAADFAFQHGFAGIDWVPDPHGSEGEFLARMEDLCGLEVRLHCRFTGADMALANREGADALTLYLQWAERAAMAGIRQMTVQLGAGNGSGENFSFPDGARNLTSLVQAAAEMGITVSLENPSSPVGGDPFIFNALVAASGCAVAMDIGNAHVWSRQQPAVHCHEYVAPCRQRLVSARIGYDGAGEGGAALSWSAGLEECLNLLLEIPACRWWVIEAHTPHDLTCIRKRVEEHISSKLPLSADLLLSAYTGSLQRP